MPMVVQPSPKLRPFIRCIAVGTESGSPTARKFERVMPTGNVDIIINLRDDELRTYDDDGAVTRASGAILSGPNTRARVIDTDEVGALVTVGFHHGGASAFVGGACAEMSDLMVDLGSVFGSAGGNLRERAMKTDAPEAIAEVVDATLVKHLRDDARPDPRVAHATDLLERGASVTEVSDALGCSTRHVARLFRDQVGMTPKLFARIQRLQRLIAALHGRPMADLAQLAADHGYFDQAHMSNEFRELTGLTPTRYAASATGERNHVAFLQSSDRTTP